MTNNNILRNASLGFIIGLTTLAAGCLNGMDEGFAPDAEEVAHPPSDVDRPESGRPQLPERETQLPADSEGDPDPTVPPHQNENRPEATAGDQPLPAAERPAGPCETEDLDLLAAHEREGRARRAWDPSSGEGCPVRPWDEDPADPKVGPGSGGDPAGNDLNPKPAQVQE